jgi:tetratricopeptide (TPR) repeat protein
VVAYQRCVELYSESRNPLRKAKAWDNLGSALQALDRHGEAVTVHHVACDLFEEGGDDYRLAMSCTNLGFALEAVGLPDDAVVSHRRALALYRAIGDRSREGSALVILGAALVGAGDYARGGECLRTTLTEFADALSPIDRAYAEGCLHDFGRPH